MLKVRLRGSCFFHILLLVLILSGQGCLPPSLNGEWKDYSKRWHVCFPSVIPGQNISISHKFLYPTVFDTGTIFKLKGDFDALNAGDHLPNEVTWTFGHFRKGVKLFEDSFVTPLDDLGRFPAVTATLPGPLPFEKNDVVKWTYTGIDVPHDTDIRLVIKF